LKKKKERENDQEEEARGAGKEGEGKTKETPSSSRSFTLWLTLPSLESRNVWWSYFLTLQHCGCFVCVVGG
jgi:hypothetical protein